MPHPESAAERSGLSAIQAAEPEITKLIGWLGGAAEGLTAATRTLLEKVGPVLEPAETEKGEPPGPEAITPVGVHLARTIQMLHKLQQDVEAATERVAL